MHIEVDQSGKIEQLNKDTYIAFSDFEHYCIKLPKGIKQELFYLYRTKISQIVPKLFAICTYYCIKDHLEKKELIIIDIEYIGWEAFIKRELVHIVKSTYPDFDKDIFRFGLITKNSNAHKLAFRAYRKEQRPDKTLTKQEILKWLK